MGQLHPYCRHPFPAGCQPPGAAGPAGAPRGVRGEQPIGWESPGPAKVIRGARVHSGRRWKRAGMWLQCPDGRRRQEREGTSRPAWLTKSKGQSPVRRRQKRDSGVNVCSLVGGCLFINLYSVLVMGASWVLCASSNVFLVWVSLFLSPPPSPPVIVVVFVVNGS